MSNRRTRGSRQSSGASRISDDQIADLVSKLQLLIPESRSTRSSDKVVFFSLSYIYRQFEFLSYI